MQINMGLSFNKFEEFDIYIYIYIYIEKVTDSQFTGRTGDRTAIESMTL